MLRRAGKFLRLAPAQRGLLLKSVGVLGSVRLGLLLCSFPRVYRTVSRLAKPRRDLPPEGRLTPEQILWALDRAGRCLPGGRNCLVRALSAKYLLERQGHATTLRIGVARDDKQAFEAHAWLECGERVLVGQVESFERFKPFPPFEKSLL